MTRPRLRFNRGLVSLLALSLVLTFAFWACSGDDTGSVTAPERGQVVTFGMDHPMVAGAIQVQEKHTRALMDIDGVLGTGIGVDDAGNPYIAVLTEYALPEDTLPAEVDGYQIRERVSGKFRAMKGPGGGGGGGGGKKGGIKLGVSGGWRYDLANGYCCGGTLGSLVTNGTTQFVLSNYHVLRSDIVSGGNGIVAQNGDPVINPGLIDVQCNANLATDVANLSGSASLPGSNVDAAIAEVIPGEVSTTGEIQQVGELSASPVAAFVGQEVKKRGRTSGLTRTVVTLLNVSVQVAYDNECAGGHAFTKTFNGQILVAQGYPYFLQGGDSGSLMVEDVRKNPHPVGLLYAASSVDAVANPIQDVLNWLGPSFEMVGK